MPLKPKEAAMRLGVSYPTLKKWIYSGKLHTVTTPGGHHRIAEAELDRFIPRAEVKAGPGRRRNFQRISGRNQLVGSWGGVKFLGLMMQVSDSSVWYVIISSDTIV